MKVRAALAVAFALCLASSRLGAEAFMCGSEDLAFGCTEARRGKEFIAGCGVHAAGRFLESEWRTYDLHSERLLDASLAPRGGIAQLLLPSSRWFVIEGEVLCADGHAIPYRFLGERVGERPKRLRTHRYSPERLAATGNWSADTQLHFGEFKARFLGRYPRRD